MTAARSDAGVPAVQRLGAVAWPSFLAAAMGAVLLFALVDPLDLAQAAWPRGEISREFGYTLGFFALWACTAASSTLTALLFGRAQPPARAHDEDQDPD